jgi:transposase
MKPYPKELRQRIVNAVKGGEPPDEVAERFEVSVATVYRYLARQRTQGHLDPTPKPGRPRAIPRAAEDALRTQVAEAQDATLAEHCATWVEQGGPGVHPATMYRAIARLGVTRKKRPSMPASVMRQSGQPGGTS